MQKVWRKQLFLAAAALALLAFAAWHFKSRTTGASHPLDDTAPPPPDFQTKNLPEDLRRAFESGQPVRIPFNPKDGVLPPLPPPAPAK